MILRKLTPHLMVKRLPDVSLDFLWEKGIRGLIIDLDNTLVPWGGFEFPPGVKSWVKEAQERGFKIFLVSNALEERVNHFRESLGIPGISQAQKPRGGAFRLALQEMGLEKNQVAVVGDQLFTDVWGGNRLGLFTILVSPVNDEEFFFTRLVRRIERRVLKRIKV